MNRPTRGKTMIKRIEAVAFTRSASSAAAI